MHIISRLLPEGVTEEDARRTFGHELVNILAKHRHTVSSMKIQYGIRLQEIVTGRVDSTPYTIQRIADCVPLTRKEAKALLSTHSGKEPSTMKEHLQVYLRGGGAFKTLAESIGCSTGQLQCILYGQKRRDGNPDTPPLL